MQGAIPESVVRDTIEAVFTDAAFNRKLGQTILGRIQEFILEALFTLFRYGHEHPLTFKVALAVLALLIIAVIVRSVYLARLQAALAARAREEELGGVVLDSRDPLASAEKLASLGRFTEAAHELYRHLLAWLGHVHGIRLHPSKTVGDYGRELRRRSESSYSPYSDFARSYEIVIYGMVECDKPRYERLLSLAGALLGRRN